MDKLPNRPKGDFLKKFMPCPEPKHPPYDLGSAPKYWGPILVKKRVQEAIKRSEKRSEMLRNKYRQLQTHL